jgi:hypothetical protein
MSNSASNAHLSLGVNWQGLEAITHLHLMPRSRMAELYLHSPICLHGMVIKNEFFTLPAEIA